MMKWHKYQAMQQVVELGPRYLSYVDEGAGSPLVLLHGMPTWGYLWAGLLADLAARYRVLIPDLLGFGFSDRSDRFDRSIERQAEALDAWMEAIGLERAAFVGHDIGGGVALRLATIFPRRVEQLCLMDSVCYDAWPTEAMLHLAYPGTVRRAPHALAEGLRRTLLHGFIASPSDDVMEGLVAPYSTEVGKVSLIRNAVALNTNHTTELSPALHRLHVPTLVLWGEQDPFLPLRYGRRLARDIPGSQLAELPDARHFIMFDRRDEAAHRLVAFLGTGPASLWAAPEVWKVG